MTEKVVKDRTSEIFANKEKQQGLFLKLLRLDLTGHIQPNSFAIVRTQSYF